MWYFLNDDPGQGYRLHRYRRDHGYEHRLGRLRSVLHGLHPGMAWMTPRRAPSPSPATAGRASRRRYQPWAPRPGPPCAGRGRHDPEGVDGGRAQRALPAGYHGPGVHRPGGNELLQGGGGTDPKAFYSCSTDIQSVEEFILRYIDRNQRWASPK